MFLFAIRFWYLTIGEFRFTWLIWAAQECDTEWCDNSLSLNIESHAKIEDLSFWSTDRISRTWMLDRKLRHYFKLVVLFFLSCISNIILIIFPIILKVICNYFSAKYDFIKALIYWITDFTNVLIRMFKSQKPFQSWFGFGGVEIKGVGIA